MLMDEKALQLLINTAQAAIVKRATPCDQEPEHIYYWGDHRTVAAPKPREHLVRSIEDLVQKLLDDPVQTVKTVWYDRRGVVGLFDDDTRRDLISFSLELSPHLLGLQENFSKWKEHRAFMRMCRVDLAGCWSYCPDFVDRVRKVKFSTNETGGSEVRREKVSLGRAIESQMDADATGGLPEEVLLSVPVFNTEPFCVYGVKCAVDIDPVGKQLQLVPLPLEIERAIKLAEASIGERIAALIDGKDNVFAYCGDCVED